MIDLTGGDKKFIVTTKVARNGVEYMGETLRLDARDAIHAEEVARKHGYTPNECFPPREEKP